MRLMEYNAANHSLRYTHHTAISPNIDEAPILRAVRVCMNKISTSDNDGTFHYDAKHNGFA